MRDQLEKRLKKVKELATLPLVVNNVIQLTQSPKSSALEVGEAISQDAALASKVLRIANSAFYGFPREITTIHLSIVVLGFANIRNIVLTASISEMMSGKVKNRYFDREAFWKHSIACAITSKQRQLHESVTRPVPRFICAFKLKSLHSKGKDRVV